MTASSLRRMPPPPPSVNDPALNRWFHDITAFISASGGIDTSTITGYTSLQSTVATHTTQISSLQTSVSTLSAAVSTLTTTVSTHTTQISTLNTQMSAANAAISALQTATTNIVRSGSGVPSAGLGNNGDVYTNQTGGAGTRLYGKYAGAWVALA